MLLVKNSDRVTCETIQERLSELHPEYKTEIANCDLNLELLGFCKSAPCDLFLDISDDDFLNLLDELMQIEVDAYNIDEDEPDERSPQFQKYKRYSWIYDVIFDAEDAPDSL